MSKTSTATTRNISQSPTTMTQNISQSPTSHVSTLSHQLLFTILAKLSLPSLVQITKVDRTLSIVAQTLLHRRASWATISGSHTLGTESKDFVRAAKDAVQTTLLGRPTLGFLHTTLETFFADTSQGLALANCVPLDCTIIGAVVQQITTVSKTSSTSSFTSNNIHDNATGMLEAIGMGPIPTPGDYTLSLASMGNDTICTPFHLSLDTLEKLNTIQLNNQQVNPNNPNNPNNLNNLEECNELLLSKIIFPTTCCAVILMASIDASNVLKPFTKWIRNRYEKDQVRVVGGLTPGELTVIHGGHCFQYPSGVVGVAIQCISGDNAVVDCQVSRACVPATEVFDIGTSTGNSIHTLLRRTSASSSMSKNERRVSHRAVDIVGQSIREHSDSESRSSSGSNSGSGSRSTDSSSGSAAGRMYFCGLSNKVEYGFHLCKIRGSLPDGSLLVDGETKEETLLQLFALDAGSSKRDLRIRLDRLASKCLPCTKNGNQNRNQNRNQNNKQDEKKNSNKKENRNTEKKTTKKKNVSNKKTVQRDVLGGLLFTCGGRGYKLYGEVGVEAKMFQETFPSKGLSGFYGLGEIGPCVRAGAVEQRSSNESGIKGRTGRKATTRREETEIMGFTSIYVLFYAPSATTGSFNQTKLEWTPKTLMNYAQKYDRMRRRVAINLENLVTSNQDEPDEVVPVVVPSPAEYFDDYELH